MPALNNVLVHTATPRRAEEIGGFVEGEADVEPVDGIPFDCCLFLPLGREENAPRGRRSVRRPTLLCAPLDRAGVELDLSPADELYVLALELTGPDPLRWQVDGYAQPFGKPGLDVIGSQVQLRRVED